MRNHLRTTGFVVIAGFLFDQLTKYLSRLLLADQSINLGVLRFDLVFNTGAAWGVFSNYTHLLTWLGVVVIVYLVLSLKRFVETKWDAIAYGCLLAGALGNTVDRIFMGKVTDFINIQIIPVFNIADMLLNCGIAIILCQSLFELRRSK